MHDVDARLGGLGVRLLVVRARPETLWQRGIEPRRDTPFMQYARKLGRTLDELHGYFVREQDRLLALSRRSRLPSLLLDVDGPIEDYVERAFAFWMQ